jgi:hypothetical protein
MIVLTLAFGSDSPELSHEELEEQLAELERQFLDQQQP